MNEQKAQKNIRVSHGRSYTMLTIGIFLFLAIFLFTIDFVPELTLDASTVDIDATTPSVSILQEEPVVHTVFAKDATDTSGMVYDVSSDDTQESFVYTALSNTPTRIVIRSIGVDTSVVTPKSTNIEVLDKALLDGAVHYPESGNLGENSNVLIFGHSSHLPVIHNQAYKAFNELNELRKGDSIVVYSNTHAYVYGVQDVWLSRAEDVQVHFDANEPLLTLATCDNFGTKQDRWIVTASLESKQIINK